MRTPFLKHKRQFTFSHFFQAEYPGSEGLLPAAVSRRFFVRFRY